MRETSRESTSRWILSASNRQPSACKADALPIGAKDPGTSCASEDDVWSSRIAKRDDIATVTPKVDRRRIELPFLTCEASVLPLYDPPKYLDEERDSVF